MRFLIAAGLAGASLVCLVACNKSATSNSAAPAPAAGSAPAASPAPGPSGPLTTQQMPHRKPGLWRQTMAMDGPSTGPGVQMCVDAASEAQMSLVTQRPGAHCDTPQFSRNLDGSLSFSNACDMGQNGKAQTTGTIKGDFNSGYTAVMRTTMSGSPVPSMNGEHSMTITATWTGPCAPGQKGGDIIFPGGRVSNVLDRAAAAKASGQ